MSDIYFGNTNEDNNKGWFVGNFIDKKLGLRHSNDLEIKWKTHQKGDERLEWVTNETRTSVAILISGKFEFIFPDKSQILSKQGDYMIWGPGTNHKWRAMDESLIITIRWPSLDRK